MWTEICAYGIAGAGDAPVTPARVAPLLRDPWLKLLRTLPGR
jgi:hypothetical protein